MFPSSFNTLGASGEKDQLHSESLQRLELGYLKTVPGADFRA